MACSSLYNFGSPVAKDLCESAKIRRSYSDSHLCYFVNGIRASSTQPKPKRSWSIGNGIFNFHFSGEMKEKEKENKEKANWVQRLNEVRSYWRGREEKEERDEGNEGCDDEDGGCKVKYCNEEEEEEEGELSIDGESFSKVLVRASWSDAKLFSQLAFLCNLAYVIPEIKAKGLRSYYGLDFITSSLEKKATAAALKTKYDQDYAPIPLYSSSEEAGNSKKKRLISPSIAYEIASSAASYIHSCAKDLLSLVSESQQEGDNAVSPGIDSPRILEEEERFPSRVFKSQMAAYVAASTMTAVVAADEKEKREAAMNLQSFYSSPCEWFVCDDSSTYTRYFVIQGSESLASWQTNLFFEPSKFEGTEVLVHRGINEAAKGIYDQFIPEIMEHLNKYGNRAKLQFTGHSLGGSLSLLVNLMLLSRKVVKPSSLLPVVTFGSPFVFCGGQKILHELGLDENHVHCVMMHRDIVPRAFSCNYPRHVAAVLKRLNGSFRSHPCLNKNKLLYTPMGKIFILQPDEKSSPPHPLLPEGSGLYALETSQCGFTNSALRAFLNTPHPLETLSNPTAYGSDGTIVRDHDSNNYLKAVNGIIREHAKMVVWKMRKQRSRLFPRLTSQSPDTWSNEVILEDSRLVNEEVMTGI